MSSDEVRSGTNVWTGALTETDLRVWAARVGTTLRHARLFVGLRGGLGTGKSTFVRSVFAGAGVDGPVVSPTFTLVHRYARLDGDALYHADLYRLTDASQLWDIGWTDLIASDSPVFVEWPERAVDYLPPDRWEVRLKFPADPVERIDTRSASLMRIGQPAEFGSLPDGTRC